MVTCFVDSIVVFLSPKAVGTSKMNWLFTRVRPEEESLANNDDLLSDEEFVVDNLSFSNAICARAKQKKHYEKNASAC